MKNTQDHWSTDPATLIAAIVIVGISASGVLAAPAFFTFCELTLACLFLLYMIWKVVEHGRKSR